MTIGRVAGLSMLCRVHAFACVALVAALGLVPTSALAQPVVVEELVRIWPAGPVRGFIATVDLTDPSVEIVVTGASTTPGVEANLTRTDTFRSSTGSRLAINANFFSTLSATTADPVGLVVSNGLVVSPVRTFNAVADPAIAFDVNRVPTIGSIASTVGVFDAVAGVGASTTDSDPGTLLITDGVNTGSTARVTPSTREPRTAIAINSDGTRLYLIVVDGRQPDWSVGVTLPELADLLLTKNAWRAINLDGGGSSAFVWQTDSGTVLANKPSDGAFRAVATNLGIKINPPAALTDRAQRPIRGAWLRPTDLTTFENTVSQLAAAGLQDIFVETLYWGRDTANNNLPQFPHRFGFDFLGQCMPIAARYGMRVHAWCETGYLDFGTNPSALLAANPDWVVKHVSVARGTGACSGANVNALTGDLASQRFVNLGNPGVRAALASYFQSLATKYPALEGIQADYHFFPLGNPPANADNVAPWSYDAWAISNYRDAAGNLVNPLPLATTCSGAVTYNTTTGVVTSGAHANWINWNRGNVTDALVILRDAVDEVSSGPMFSAVSFGAWNAAVHVSKMIDLPSWGSKYGAEAFFIMAYQTSTANISNELNLAQTALPGRRVVAGLANLTNTSRPSVTQQLNAMQGRGIEDFCWFDAPTFINNSAGTQATLRSQLLTWVTNTAAKLQGDVTANGTSSGSDGRIDARDLAFFASVYSGTPVPRTAANDRCDINRDGVIDATDRLLIDRAFNRFHFGYDDIVDGRDLAALRAAFTPGPAPNPAIQNLWDLNGDGAVNYADQLLLHARLTVTLPPDLDANDDGQLTVEDVYAFMISPRDVDRSGDITSADLPLLIAAVRAGEQPDMTSGRR
jgi:exopolysaccharide biosynthesis protein/uncharacterized lipoprotein YddW (UPF0748 family)